MTGEFDQFTRWLCPKCGHDGIDSWNKYAFDGAEFDPEDPAAPLIFGDDCQRCFHPIAVRHQMGARPRAILGPHAGGEAQYQYEEEAFLRLQHEPEECTELQPASTRDADWSNGCIAAKGQLQ